MGLGRLWSYAFSFLGMIVCALPNVAIAQQVAAVPSPSFSDHTLKTEELRTKFVIGLERAVDFQVFALTNPNRVYVELPDVKMQLPTPPGQVPVGLVKSFRGGLSAPGKMRIIIDVTGPVIIEKSAIEKEGKAARLVLDIVSATQQAADAASDAVNAALAKRSPALASGYSYAAADLQPPMPRPAVSPQARASTMYKPVIVLDPGHGGDDTGAQKYGTVEKQVVLAFALKLRDKLNATGRYKVLMTRDTDVFIELTKRREFAEQHMASLFVAIHADYAGSQARGATIYSLRDSVAEALQRSAKGEVSQHVLTSEAVAGVKSAQGDVGAVSEILSDLARREVEMTRERTSVFARSVIEFMGTTTNLKDNPDRSAAFVVLKTAKVPSILIELGYVTNTDDAQLLKSEKWREKVSGSITTAIDNYFGNQLARLPM